MTSFESTTKSGDVITYSKGMVWHIFLSACYVVVTKKFTLETILLPIYKITRQWKKTNKNDCNVFFKVLFLPAELEFEVL